MFKSLISHKIIEMSMIAMELRVCLDSDEIQCVELPLL